MDATERTRQSLTNAVTRAKRRYDLARAARQDSGSRIESAREARARCALDDARAELTRFNRQHDAGA